jgi:hypothetical protein
VTLSKGQQLEPSFQTSFDWERGSEIKPATDQSMASNKVDQESDYDRNLIAGMLSPARDQVISESLGTERIEFCEKGDHVYVYRRYQMSEPPGVLFKSDTHRHRFAIGIPSDIEVRSES